MNVPSDQYELYAEFGLAAEKAQIMELEAGNVALSFVTLFFVKTSQITPEEALMYRSLETDVNRKTLGKLLEHVKRLGKMDESLLKIVDTGLERRNYLVHKFFRTHNYAVCDAVGRKAMIEELRDIQKAIELAWSVLSAMSSILLSFAGLEGAAEGLDVQLSLEGKSIKL